MPTLQTVYYILAIAGLIGGAIWASGRKFGHIETIVTEIRDNHLFHMGEDIKGIKSSVGDLQQRVSKLED